MTGPLVAVIGAGGVTGRPVIQALQAREAKVRVLTRHTEGLSRFAEDVDIVRADLLDIVSLERAIETADSIHYIPPSFDPRELEFAKNLIAAAERVGVARIVYHSVLHAMTPEMPHHFRKAQVESLLRHSRLEWTVLQPAMYAQTALAFFDAEAGKLTPAFDPVRLFTPIHDQDLAEAAAIVHTTDQHNFATYELAGPETLDFISMGAKLSEIVGRPVTTEKAPAEELSERVAAARKYSDAQVTELKLMFDHYDAYGLVGNGNVLRMILGRGPTDFSGAMRQNLASSADKTTG